MPTMARKTERRAAVVPIVVLVVCVALVATVAGIIVAGSLRHPSRAAATVPTREQREREAAVAWEQQAADAFHPLTTAVPDLAGKTASWLTGATPLPTFQAALAADVPAILDSRNQVGALPEFPFDRRVNDLYWQSSLLYTEMARIDVTLVDLPAGPLRDQEGVAARRLHELADRVFDRGRALLIPFRHDPPSPEVVANLPEEVPNWTLEGLAADAPLDTLPAGASDTPQLSQPTRPQEPKPQWKDDVDRAGIPTLPALTSAVDGDGSTGGAALASQLRNLADAYLSAAETLRARPDPAGDREEGARLRLSLLVYAEGARQAEAGALTSDPTAAERLNTTARRLLLIGDVLWPDELGNHNSGEPADLLRDQTS